MGDNEAMTPAAYERYVSELVSQLSFTQHGKIYRNKRFEGVRQPGSYEIDIAVEFTLGPLDFLLIVECKNWRRPVDRPVIQKLAQTKDAIGAHKAAVASPVGFTPEAVEVSQVHGIALWVVSEVEWQTMMAHREITDQEIEYSRTRRYFLHNVLEYQDPGSGEVTLTSFKKVQNSSLGGKEDTDTKPWVKFRHFDIKGSIVRFGYEGPFLAGGDAVSDIVDEMIRRYGSFGMASEEEPELVDNVPFSVILLLALAVLILMTCTRVIIGM